MNVAITGGSGFIGSHLVPELLAAGHTVRSLDKHPNPELDVSTTLGDVRDREALEEVFRDAEVVYHLAAEHRDDVRPPELYYDVNVRGAENVVAAADSAGVKTIVFTSTVAVYGLDDLTPDESAPTRPFNEYGRSKLQAESVFREWTQRGGGRRVVIVRPTVVFGEGNRGNVHSLIDQIAGGRFLMVGSGKNKKSMCYVGNLTRFLIRVLEAPEGLTVVNYVDKPDLSMNELVQLIRTELEQPPKIRLRVPYILGLLAGHLFDALRGMTKRNYVISSIRVRKFCANTQIESTVKVAEDFQPPFTLREGLRRMIQANSYLPAADRRAVGPAVPA